jgi:hypothetical protein
VDATGNMFVADRGNHRHITVNIRDGQGRTVYARDAGKPGTGNQTLRLAFNGSGLAEGVYLVTLQVNGKVHKTIPILKAKR